MSNLILANELYFTAKELLMLSKSVLITATIIFYSKCICTEILSSVVGDAWNQREDDVSSSFSTLVSQTNKFGTMPNHSDFASAPHFQLHPLICYQCFTTHWYQDVRIWNTPHICIAVPCILIGWTINYVYTVMYIKPPAIPTLAIHTTASQQRIFLFFIQDLLYRSYSLNMVSMLGPSHLMGDIYIPRYNNIEENLDKLETFIPEDTDYFLCSYPKSGNGTTWFTVIFMPIYRW